MTSKNGSKRSKVDSVKARDIYQKDFLINKSHKTSKQGSNGIFFTNMKKPNDYPTTPIQDYLVKQ